MKAKCYYCNKELTERTIKRHMKTCSEMKKIIDEKGINDKEKRNQFIIAIKPKYAGNEYCIYLSIDGTLGLIYIDQFIRDIWVECCGHLSGFRIKGKFYQEYSMNAKLNDILNIDEKFEYEYDFGSTTHLILEVVDIIQVPSSFSQIEIIARNNEIKHECEICGAEAKYFSYEKDEWECESCIDKDDDMISKFDYCNSPRDGVCGYDGHKEAENIYLPGNDKKYKLSKKKIKEQDDYKSISAYDDDFFDDLPAVEYAFDDLLSKSKSIANNTLNKGIYSFDIKELISNLSKENIYDIAKYLGMTKISSLNKSKLIEMFLDGYELLIEERLSLFDEERYKDLKSYSDKGGEKVFKEIKGDNVYKVGYFLQNGMLFSACKDGELVILMPEVVQKLVKEKNNIQYRSMIKSNSEIVNLYRGMNKAYGLLKLKDIKELFKRYAPYKESAQRIQNNAPYKESVQRIENNSIYESHKYRIEDVITNAEDYYREYEIQGTFFVNCYIDNWVNLLKRIEQQTNVDYTMISKEELLSMSDENYIYESKCGKIFIKEFLSMFNIDEDILEGLMESLYLEIQENELEDVVNEILEQLEDDNKEIKDFMSNSVDKFLRNIKLWKYKGSTIKEKEGSMIKNEKQKPVRRNEPCSCGSGKKYKNCCARNGNVINLF
ncbi:MAG: SEC-C domain-containing protein [Clostridium sp.]|uniref:SEC-C metal-binding domain-containing protein n=1 Tax=Clostridium sp. TaxID=1506 RepID=UPI0025B81C9D|nr:SEC-C metal-binding domain-containing protein [Clostridium sp.]MCE5219832.1 SEC-C domain-containing protein [Clostridium sp.]